ncbi:MAG: DUF5522 domain-containing protein [Fimbriiglobus sp.]
MPPPIPPADRTPEGLRPPPACSPPPVVEGVHYYIENGRWVFTDRYHRERGHCCESGCRHCPWGFRKAGG